MIDHATDCRIVFGHCTCKPITPADWTASNPTIGRPVNSDLVDIRDCPGCGRMQYLNRIGAWQHAYPEQGCTE